MVVGAAAASERHSVIDRLRRLGRTTTVPLEGRIIVGFFMLALGCLFGSFGVYMTRQSWKRSTKGVAADGTVIGQKEWHHGGPRLSDTTYSPQVEFQTPSGERIVFTGSISSGNPPRLGRKVKVRYYPDNPHDADIASPLTAWILPFLLLTLGLGTLFIFVVVCFVVPGK
jgi:hypothetical protein